MSDLMTCPRCGLYLGQGYGYCDAGNVCRMRAETRAIAARINSPWRAASRYLATALVVAVVNLPAYALGHPVSVIAWEWAHWYIGAAGIVCLVAAGLVYNRRHS